MNMNESYLAIWWLSYW